jgi:hypothetical protein
MPPPGELLQSRPHGRVLVGRVLELDNGHRQAVHEEHHVRTPTSRPNRDQGIRPR